MPGFAVVEFVQENSVSFVPETWVETRNGVSTVTVLTYQLSFTGNCKYM